MADIRSIGRHKKPVDFSGFTPLGNQGSVFTVTEDASPELYALAAAHPALLRRALRHVAYLTLFRLKEVIREGGPKGVKWPERSLMHRYRRLDMWFNERDVSLKQKTGSGKARLSPTGLRRAGKKIGGRFSLLKNFGENSRRSFRYWTRGAVSRGQDGKLASTGGRLVDAEQSIPDAFSRWKSPHGRSGHRNRIAMSGAIYSNLVYNKTGDLEYSIGILTHNLAEKLKIVQEGKTTPVTAKLRRSFWAAGVPLDDAKTELVMPPRPLVDPVFKELQPRMEELLMNRIKGYLEGSARYV